MPTFRTALWSEDGRNTGIVVPEHVVLSFDKGKRVPVVVTVDGDYSYRSTIASMGGQYLIPFSSQHREATGKGLGDEIEVDLIHDDAPRVFEPHEDLAHALAADPAAAEAWGRLSFSKQRQLGEPVGAAKTNETRRRRVEKAIATLRGE